MFGVLEIIRKHFSFGRIVGRQKTQLHERQNKFACAMDDVKQIFSRLSLR